MVEDQVPMVVKMIKALVASRHAAAEVLERVTEYGRDGYFPGDVTCEELGRALFRITMNAQGEDPLLGILAGWRVAEKEFYDRLARA